jgi:hypothetical protein
MIQLGIHHRTHGGGAAVFDLTDCCAPAGLLFMATGARPPDGSQRYTPQQITPSYVKFHTQWGAEMRQYRRRAS